MDGMGKIRCILMKRPPDFLEITYIYKKQKNQGYRFEEQLERKTLEIGIPECDVSEITTRLGKTKNL